MCKGCANCCSRVVVLPGGAGCQPAVVGSIPATFIQCQSDVLKKVSASCRDLQAGSLRSPEGKKNSTTVAVGNLGKLFPAQAQPIVPCLTHAVARGEITLIELIAFDDLRERGFHRKFVAIQNGIGGSDGSGMMG